MDHFYIIRLFDFSKSWEVTNYGFLGVAHLPLSPGDCWTLMGIRETAGRVFIDNKRSSHQGIPHPPPHAFGDSFQY